MKNYLLILKLLIKNMNIFKKKKDGGGLDATRTTLVILLLFSYVSICVMVVGMVAVSAAQFHKHNATNEFIAVLFGGCSIVVVLFGVVAILNQLYFSRDTEFFLALPVKPAVIYFAKFTIIYLTELVIAVAFLFPSLLTIGIVTKMNAGYYFVSLFGIFLAPSLPIMLASILSVPLMYVISFFKNKGALTSIVVIVLFGGVFAAYFYFTMSFSQRGIGVDADVIAVSVQKFKVLANIVYPFLALCRLATFTSFGGFNEGVSAVLNLLIFLGSLFTLILISIVISNLIYKRGASSQLEGIKKISTGKEEFVSSSKLKALVKREWRELIRTPSFAYNSLICVIFAPIMIAVIMLTSLKDVFATFQSDPMTSYVATISDSLLWFCCLGLLLMFGVGLNISASSAITREGKNFYFSKMLPVSYKVQLQAKLIVCCCISAAAIILGLIVITIIVPDPAAILPALIYAALYGYAFNCFSLYFDLSKPKLDWNTPNEAMKQNFNVMLPYLINMLISSVALAFPIILLILIQNEIIAKTIIWLILIMASGAAAFIFHIRLFKKADSLYDKLSV